MKKIASSLLLIAALSVTPVSPGVWGSTTGAINNHRNIAVTGASAAVVAAVLTPLIILDLKKKDSKIKKMLNGTKNHPYITVATLLGLVLVGGETLDVALRGKKSFAGKGYNLIFSAAEDVEIAEVEASAFEEDTQRDTTQEEEVAKIVEEATENAKNEIGVKTRRQRRAEAEEVVVQSTETTEENTEVENSSQDK